MVNNAIQSYPTSDSPENDAFEAIVKLYFELQGYLTSSGKWFWKMEEGKQQRGYQDIDVLAVNGIDTIIVSVASNFDDKLSKKNGAINHEKADKFLQYFSRVEEYLATTESYRWLVADRRNVIRVLAVINQPKKLDSYKGFLDQHKITVIDKADLLSGKNGVLTYLKDHQKKGLKIKNPILRVVQLMELTREP